MRDRRIAGGRDGSLTIHQDVTLYSGRLGPGATLRRDLSPGRHAWVQVTRSAVTLSGHVLAAGDDAAISDEPGLTISAEDEAEVLFFDMA